MYFAYLIEALTKMKNLRFYSWLLTGFLFLAGCKDEYSICNESKNVLLKTNLYAVNSGVEQPFAAASFSLTVLNNTQPIYNNIPNLSSFLMPLNPAMDSIKFQLLTSNTAIADTLTILYSSYNVQLSAACGNLNVHRLLRVSSTNNSIDSVQIKDAVVANMLTENIKIYY